MPEIANNRAQKLTEKDKIMLDKVITNFIYFFSQLMNEYPNAKDYAKIVPKMLNTNNQSSALRALAYLKNNHTYNHFIPKDFNKELRKRVSESVLENQMSMKSGQKNDDKLLRSTALRENVLQRLEKAGIVDYAPGLEEYNKYKNKRPGRKPSGENEDDKGGKRVTYYLAENIDKLRKVIEKSESIDYLNDKIRHVDGIEKVVEYMILTSLYLLKSDVNSFINFMDIGANFNNEKLDEQYDVNILNRSNLSHQLENDEQIKEYARSFSRFIIQRKQFYQILSMFYFGNAFSSLDKN